MATACETAHCMVPLAGVTEKFSAERQKVVVALLLLRRRRRRRGRCRRCGWRRVWRRGPATFGVEADGDVEVIVAGEEEEGVALGAELVVLLDGVDAIDLGLHGRRWAWRERRRRRWGRSRESGRRRKRGEAGGCR